MNITAVKVTHVATFREAADDDSEIMAPGQTAGVTLIPHARGITHLHVAMAHVEIPMIEHFPLSCREDPADAGRGENFAGEPQPEGGKVTRRDTPGPGVTLTCL